MHILAAGCTHFGTCAPGECTLFQSFIHYMGMNTRTICQMHDVGSFCTRVVHKINVKKINVKKKYKKLHWERWENITNVTCLP